MSTYLNIYLIDTKTKTYNKLYDYGGSSTFSCVLSEVCNIPYVSGEEEQYVELSSSIINRCIETIDTLLEEHHKAERHRQEAYKEAKEMMVSVLSSKPYSLEDIKTAIGDFTWESTEEDEEGYVAGLKKAKDDFLFYKSLLRSFELDEDAAFCGIALNKY